MVRLVTLFAIFLTVAATSVSLANNIHVFSGIQYDCGSDQDLEEGDELTCTPLAGVGQRITVTFRVDRGSGLLCPRTEGPNDGGGGNVGANDGGGGIRCSPVQSRVERPGEPLDFDPLDRIGVPVTGAIEGLLRPGFGRSGSGSRSGSRNPFY